MLANEQLKMKNYLNGNRCCLCVNPKLSKHQKFEGFVPLYGYKNGHIGVKGKKLMASSLDIAYNQSRH